MAEQPTPEDTGATEERSAPSSADPTFAKKQREEKMGQGLDSSAAAIAVEANEVRRGGPEPEPARLAEGAELHNDEEAKLVDKLKKRFVVAGDTYHFKDESNTVAFQVDAAEERISTTHNYADVAHAMVDLARSKGWETIEVRGSEPFKREAWMRAQELGIEVAGYEPDALARMKLAERAVAAVGSSRDASRANTARQSAGSSDERTKAVDENPGMSRQQVTAVEALRAVLQERGDTPIQVEAAVSAATERFTSKRVYIGKVLEVGEGPYNNDPKQGTSPFIRLDTPQGVQMVWGVDIPRAVENGKVSVGDQIVLAQMGAKPVTVEDRDDDGAVKVRTVNRNQWAAEQVEQIRAQALTALQARSEQTSMQPKVNTIDRGAPTQQRSAPVASPPPPTQQRDIGR